MSTTIAVTKRWDDYHACFEGESQPWEAGRSEAEALGKLVISHPERFMTRVLQVPRAAQKQY